MDGCDSAEVVTPHCMNKVVSAMLISESSSAVYKSITDSAN